MTHELSRSVGAQSATGEIAPEGMKRLSQSRNNAQLWMCLVVEVKFKAIKKDIEKKPGILGPCVCVLVAQSFSTLCDPMRPHSPSGSFVHGILKARILK